MDPDRGHSALPNRRPRPAAPETVELSDNTTHCAVCNGVFKPRGGESTCSRCSHRTREVLTAPRVGVRREQLLIDASMAVAASSLTATIAIGVLGVVAIALTAIDWWAGALGDAGGVAVWAVFFLVGIISALPIITPPPGVQYTPRWLPFLAPVAAGFILAVGVIHAVTSPPTPVAIALAIPCLLMVPLFIGGVASRLGRLASWAGYDATEAGMMVQAGPLFVGCFVAGMCGILSWFFLRRPSLSALVFLGVATWLVVRSLIVASAVAASLRSMFDEARREERQR